MEKIINLKTIDNVEPEINETFDLQSSSGLNIKQFTGDVFTNQARFGGSANFWQIGENDLFAQYETGGTLYFRAGKSSFTDTAAGFCWGIGNGIPKFILGDSLNWVDWNVTTADTLTISGTIYSSVGIIGGWVITTGYIYNLQSGTPTVAPNDGVVLASGNEGIIIYEDTAKRVELGYLSAGVYGIKGYDGAGTGTLFELSDTQTIIAGWTISATTLANSTNIILDASNKAISINSATYGQSGIQFQYNAGTPRVYVGDGATQFFKFDGTNPSWSGGSITSTVLTALQAGTEISIQGWQNTCVFSATDSDTVAWAAGAITLLTGTVYTISGGNTGNMAATTYIYLDIAVSITVLQTTTTAATAVGTGKILVAVAKNNTDATSKATFQVFGGTGGVMLGVDYLAANSASVNEFVSNTAQIKDLIVTDAKINTLTVAKLTSGTIASQQISLGITAGTGDIFLKGGTVNEAAWTATNGFILGLDDSDSDKEKFYIGTATSWMDWNVTTVNKLTITDANISGTLTVGTIGLQNLCDNGDFEDWSAGVATDPDAWAKDTGAGWGGTSERDAAIIKIGTYSCKLTSEAAKQSRLFQSVHIEKGIAYWLGRTVTVGAWVYATNANTIRIGIVDNITWGWSSYHSGGSTWEFLTATKVIDAGGGAVNIGLVNEGFLTVGYYDGVMCVEGSSAMPFSPKYRQWGHTSDYAQLNGGAIYANTITATSIATLVMTGKTCNFDTGTVGGWTMGATTLANGTNIILDASNKTISINDATFGNLGIQLQYNAGTPRAHVGSTTNYLQFDGTKTVMTAGSGSSNMIVSGGTIHGSFILRGDNDAGGGSAPVIKQVFSGSATATNDYIYIVFDDSNADGRVTRYNRTKANAIFRDIDDIEERAGGTAVVWSGCYDGTYVYMRDQANTAFVRRNKDLTNESLSNTVAVLTATKGGTYDGTYYCFVAADGVSLNRYTFAGAPWDWTLFDTITLSNAITGSLCWNATNSCWYGFDSATNLIRKFSAAGVQSTTLSIVENVVGIMVFEGKLFVAYTAIDPVVSATSKWLVNVIPFDL